MQTRYGLTAVALVMFAVAGCADRERASVADARLMFSGETNFGRVPVHATRELRVSLQNVGRSYVNLREVWVEDQDGAYLAKLDPPGAHEVIPGATCELVLRFTPRRPGALPATLVMLSDSLEEPYLRVDLLGEGVDARARIREGRLDFGRIELGSEKRRTLTLENPSDLEVKVTPAVVGADRDEFTISPLTLGPGERREVEVLFRPTRVGKKRATLAIQPCEGCADEVVDLIAEGLDRAIVAEPTELDFGQVPMDREATLTVTLRNISTESQEVHGLVLTEATDPSFTHVGGTTPVLLGGGESREFTFRYTPGHMGPAEGASVFSIGSRRNPELRVPMFGFGGAAELCVSPPVVDYGSVPVGARVPATVKIKNCGSPNGAALTVTELVMGASGSGATGYDQFNLGAVALPRDLAAGEEMSVRVFFEPTRAGDAAGAVGVRSTGFQGSLARVELRGVAQAIAPCSLQITPETVDFGTVRPRHDAVLGIKIHNAGTDVCPVKNIRLADDGGGVFFMPGGDLEGVILYPGYGFSFMVGYLATQTGASHSGLVQIEMYDPVNPRVLVPVIANTQDSCLVAVPTHLDFGVARPDCPPSPQTTLLTNVCATPVQVDSVGIGPGTTDGEFVIRSGPTSFPLVLQPGDAVPVEVEYRAQSYGLNLSPLYVGVDGLVRPLLVPLIGESVRNREQIDRFVQQDGAKADVLFVVDNTASMVEEHPRLVQAIPAFVAAAQQRGVDLHVAVTTTGLDPISSACPGGADGGEAGRLFPADNARPRILSLSTPNLTSILQQNVQVGQCAQVEKGFEAMRRALSSPLVDRADDPRTPLPNDGNLGFLREEASLAVVFVGDEDDHSPEDVDSYLAFLRGLKGLHQPQRTAIYALAPTGNGCSTAGGTGTRYAEAAAKTGGQVLSICATDYSPLMQSVATRAFSPQDRFPLSATPGGPVRVYVDGVEQTSGWSWDAGNNQVVFSSRPAAGAHIEVRYEKICGA